MHIWSPPYLSIYLSTGVDGLSFRITNYNGTVTSECPEGYFSTVIFNCNSTAIWSEADDHNITKFMRADPELNTTCEVDDSCNNVIVLCVLCYEIYITSRVLLRRGVGGIHHFSFACISPCLFVCQYA